MKKWILAVSACVAFCGCAGQDEGVRVDWTEIVSQGVPESRSGDCGVEWVWSKDVYHFPGNVLAVEVVIRPQCIPTPEEGSSPSSPPESP